MTAANHAGPSPALVEAIAGLSAGTASTLVVHPLDVIKTRMQIYRSTQSLNPQQRLTTLAVARSLIHPPPAAGSTTSTNILASLYRGLTPSLLGSATSWASFFFVKSRIERALLSLRSEALTSSIASATTNTTTAAKLTPTDYFISSGLSGIFVQILTNPIWVLKTRIMSSDRTALGAYPSTLSGAVQLYSTEGIRGFYRGLGVSLFGVSHGAVQFAVYEPLKQRLAVGRDDTKGKRIANNATIVASTVSKLIAGAVTYPYQVVRSRLQNYDAEARFGKGIRGVVKRLWAEEGVWGFYRGIVPGVVRVLPATWVTFLVYENTRYYLPRWFEGP